jgi:hypothetical protein
MPSNWTKATTLVSQRVAPAKPFDCRSYPARQKHLQ